MTELSLPHKVARTAGKQWGCLFHCDAFDIEEMVKEKMISFTFGKAVVPEIRTPIVGAGKP